MQFPSFRRILRAFAAASAALVPLLAAAAGLLEVPAQGSSQSGIGVIEIADSDLCARNHLAVWHNGAIGTKRRAAGEGDDAGAVAGLVRLEHGGDVVSAQQIGDGLGFDEIAADAVEGEDGAGSGASLVAAESALEQRAEARGIARGDDAIKADMGHELIGGIVHREHGVIAGKGCAAIEQQGGGDGELHDG